MNARVVHVQLVERVAQVRVVGAVGREDAGEDHRLDSLKPGERLGRGSSWRAVTVSPTWLSWTLLMLAAR